MAMTEEEKLRRDIDTLKESIRLLRKEGAPNEQVLILEKELKDLLTRKEELKHRPKKKE
jgi:hypothetical protein